MSQFSKETYIKIFDGLLSEELHFSSVYASETNIQTAIKRVLGKAVQNNYISLYFDLVVHPNLNVSFKIKDPEDASVIPIDLKYGE